MLKATENHKGNITKYWLNDMIKNERNLNTNDKD